MSASWAVPLLAEAAEPGQAEHPRVDREDAGGVETISAGGSGRRCQPLGVHAEVVVLEQVPDVALGANEAGLDGVERPVVGPAGDQAGEAARALP
jgi:hypothetical protein